MDRPLAQAAIKHLSFSEFRVHFLWAGPSDDADVVSYFVNPWSIKFPKYFVFASLCSFICLQAVYQLSGPVCKATWNGCPSYSASHLHFTLCD